MERHDVERIIKDVLNDLGASFSLIILDRTMAEWTAMLKGVGGRVIKMPLPDGPPSYIRATVAQRIEAEN
jgi:hypothetical protein